ncbi:hypothetical protein [Amycolatopsis palatopharyngis]|uniref:hypothetical protein n=1 Tax=Amycolatopsis palatopharyngis TaxID=187982 RepID=UPI000E220822|nr:hypothetical protein [Amycolatopsis palatopharyngis]
MTAPTRSRAAATRSAQKRSRATTAGTETPRATRSQRQPAQQRTTAAERAYARRAQRAELSQQDTRAVGELVRARKWLPRLRGPRSRASFVVMMMCLLAAGVATTLWLSTQAIADTYRLDELNENNARLLERKEQLQQQVTSQESATALAERAKALGMVPAVDPGWLVVEPDGSVRVVGDPKKAEKKAAATAPPAPDSSSDDPPAGNDSDGAPGETEADRIAGAAGPQGDSGDGGR